MSDPDILDELKNWKDERGYPTPGEVMDRAVAEITRLRAEVERLRLTEAERATLYHLRDWLRHIPDVDALLARLGGDQ